MSRNSAGCACSAFSTSRVIRRGQDLNYIGVAVAASYFPSLPSPSRAVPKVAGDEQTKEDALTVKASEALARVKLADAEVAINSAKEEVGRARAEAEQAKAEAQKAKADAQAARDAEVLAQRKLADAEAAHATAEEACSSPAEPGLAGRLREWFKRPRTIKNP